MTVWRLFDPPRPSAIAAVSPVVTVTFARSAPSCSATTCASIVFVPCPIAAAPVYTCTRPEGPIRTVADSKGPRPVPLQ